MGKRGRHRVDIPSSSSVRPARTADVENPYLMHRTEDTNPFTGRPYSKRYHSILSTRATLPIYESRQLLLDTVKKNPVVILEGETGSGKTTQVPQFLIDAGYARDDQTVCCTQPRRVAAISVARRVSEEMDVPLGDAVGYTVRFEDRSGPNTVLKYLTDGMLLREAMTDNDFSAYSVVILDEAHERTLSTDILLSVLKTVVKRRDDFRLIIMSATMDIDRFRKFFDDAPLLSIPGRTFPVDIYFSSSPENDYVEAAIRTAIEICEKEPPGDILIFLTGEEDIEYACQHIYDVTSSNEHVYGRVAIYPLYGALPPHVQQRVFQKAPEPAYAGGPPGRKIICATNIAETSLTIDGVVYVIDAGFSKQKIYNPRTRVESLLIDNISQASAKQRAGRAGRTQKGKCYRLYTKKSFEEDLQKTSYPEILRSNLGNVVLQMLKLGVEDLVHFDFMDPPAPESLMRALEILNYLGAIDDDGHLTEFGDRMIGFPLEPEASAALIRSPEFQCSAQVVTIVAMLSEAGNCILHSKQRGGKRDRNGRKVRDNIDPRKQFEHGESDHLMYVNVFEQFQKAAAEEQGGEMAWCEENLVNPRALRSAESVRSQLCALMKKAGLEMISTASEHSMYSTRVRKALLCGYFMQVGHRTSKKGMFKTVKDEATVRLHPSSRLRKDVPWITYNEYVLTERDNYIRTCSIVEPAWLIEIAPHYFDLSNFPRGVMRDALEREYRMLNMRRRKEEEGGAAMIVE